MEAVKRLYTIPESRELTIKIPDYIPVNEKAEIILLFKISPDVRKKKIELMKQAMHDPLFLEDLNEIGDDFKHVDNESWPS